MDNKKNVNNKANRNTNLDVNNDQLGENASEEFKSEEYTNSMLNKKNKGTQR